MQVGRAAKLGQIAEPDAERFVARRRGEEAVDERAQVEACSATDNWQAVALGNSTDGFAGEAAIVSGGAWSVGRKDVDEVVGDAGALGKSGLGGADLHAAIDGDRVAGDYLAGELLGEGKGEGCLAAGGGAGDDEERRERLCAVYQSRHQPVVKTRCTPARRIAKTIAARVRRSRPRSWRRRTNCA
jgi:hypothetical protein